ncbi:hypothetical protein N431DRAFT_475621 [Stipitochalara longipes BDJ]|nr:hypothetical protein N431DRAFT_475621 [Stipitochalara longipes BDJ]
MAIIKVFLVSLTTSTTSSTFLEALKSSSLKPLITARVIQWIIHPTQASYLLTQNWDFMLILTPPSTLPDILTSLIAHTFSITIQEPDDFLTMLKAENTSWLYPKPEDVPKLTHLDAPLIATGQQRVELTPSLLAFANSKLCPEGPISMLNLVSFQPFESCRKSYAEYVDALKAGIGTRHGACLKVWGDAGVEEKGVVGEWEEVVLAGYSSLKHFADMLADEDYQDVNLRLRLPALRDTCILMTSEVKLDWRVEGAVRWNGGN